MKDYIAFIAGLPELVWNDRKLSLTLHDFREQAESYIEGDDKRLLDTLFLFYDNRQILKLLNKHEPDCELETVFPLKVLEEDVVEPEHVLPAYLNEFIVRFKDGHTEYEQRPENVLSLMYYEYMIHSENSFLADYVEFAMNLKNLITALNCKKFGKDMTSELIGHNEFAEALKSAHSKDFGLSVDYPWVEKILSFMENKNLVDRERAIDLLIWDYIEEHLIFTYFSIERVIGFALELMIVERWSKMDSESGREVFRELIEKFKKSVVFEKQFE